MQNHYIELTPKAKEIYGHLDEKQMVWADKYALGLTKIRKM
jgi:hypothetical protein